MTEDKLLTGLNQRYSGLVNDFGNIEIGTVDDIELALTYISWMKNTLIMLADVLNETGEDSDE